MDKTKMHKWHIDIILKSGKEVSGVYFGVEDNIMDVALEVFAGKCENDYISLHNFTAPHSHLFVNAGEIAAFDIRPFTIKKED